MPLYGSMLIEDSFFVAAEPRTVFHQLADIERVVPCIPGARLTRTLDDTTWEGEMATRLGPLSLVFVGTVALEDRDEQIFRIRMRAQGKDRKGKGGASMLSTAQLASIDGGTRVALSHDMKVSGTIGQFGYGVMQDVSKRMVADFAAGLQAMITGGAQDADASPDQPPHGIPRAREPIGLGRILATAVRRAFVRLALRSRCKESADQ
jgi:carbon monoxide dehydrogenase subunit G